MGKSSEVALTVRTVVKDGWGATARLSVLLLVAAVAAAVVLGVAALGSVVR